jgi:hypothetical protein
MASKVGVVDHVQKTSVLEQNTAPFNCVEGIKFALISRQKAKRGGGELKGCLNEIGQNPYVLYSQSIKE